MQINVTIQLPEDIQNAPHCPTLGELTKRIGNAARNAVIANTLGEEPRVCISYGAPETPRREPSSEIVSARKEVARLLALLNSWATNLDKTLSDGR